MFKAIEFIRRGLVCLWHRKLEVEVLDALSIGVSLLRSDFNTAGSVMFLLNVGALLEEWTRKKSLDDLARSMSLNVDRVWVRSQGTEVLMPITKVKAGGRDHCAFWQHGAAGWHRDRGRSHGQPGGPDR